VQKYSDEFKLTAVRLSQLKGLQVKTVALALEIHPFMLSKWRKDARDGRLRGRAESTAAGSRARDRPAAGAREGACAPARGACPPKKSHSVLFRSKGDAFAFIDTQRPYFSVASLCRRYGVTPAGFYAWRCRGESVHAEQDRRLATEIDRLFRLHQARCCS
jgi:transposase-like protein